MHGSTPRSTKKEKKHDIILHSVNIRISKEEV